MSDSQPQPHPDVPSGTFQRVPEMVTDPVTGEVKPSGRMATFDVEGHRINPLTWKRDADLPTLPDAEVPTPPDGEAFMVPDEPEEAL